MIATSNRNARLALALSPVAALLLSLLLLAAPAKGAFEIRSFDGGVFATNGDTVTQAGARPNRASTEFTFTEYLAADGLEYAFEEFKDVIVDLPPGLVGNPTGVPSCAESVLSQNSTHACPIGSQIGYIKLLGNGKYGIPGNPGQTYWPVVNLSPPGGKAALFGFNALGAVFHFSGELVRDEGVEGDYRISATALSSPQTIPLAGVEVTVWGVPADPDNDADRGWGGDVGGTSCAKPGSPSAACVDPNPSPEPLKPFFTLPTSCDGPVQTDLFISTWQGGSDSSSFLSHDNFDVPVGNEDCAALGLAFAATTLAAKPTTNVADSPSGLEVDLHIPQDESCEAGPPVSCANATAHLRDTTVALPEGMTINPSGANGLDGCSQAEFDLRGTDPAQCPDAAKVGTVEVTTPLLGHPVPGAVYVADPFANPFNSLLAIYIALHDPISGTVAKVAGEVRADPVTGQLTTTVEENPQVPFEHFRLSFFGGAHAPLKTPATCGDYATVSQLTPWSAPDSGAPVTSTDPWQIAQSPAGACAALTNAPAFDAGTVSPISARYSPFVLRLRRTDGSQRFRALNVSLPPGLTGKLAGTALCPEGALAAAAAKSGNEESANPSCPLNSRVGAVEAAAGAGPAPYHAQGIAYLAGPYKGAPVSMAVITPATAGPFDLGTVVIRSPIHVDPKTAQISAVTDPIPQILQGIPLDVRSVHVVMDRPEFTLTGTSCKASAVGGLLTSTLNQVAALSSRYQLSDCGRLPFKPRISLKLRGKTKRGGHPALRIAISPRPGDANISFLSISLPRSEFLENAHIRTICTRPDFAADRCPAGAVYGRASVWTSLLDYPLTGNVYLRSSDNLLPDVVPDLRGPAHQPIKLESSGRTDSIRGGIRNTLDFVPDAPFSRAVVAMQGGNKGLLVNSRNICARTYRAKVRFAAHNGRTHVTRPKMRVKCKGNKRKAKRRGHKRKGKRGAKRSAVALRSAVR